MPNIPAAEKPKDTTDVFAPRFDAPEAAGSLPASGAEFSFDTAKGDFISGYVFSGGRKDSEWGTMGLGGLPEGVSAGEVQEFDIAGDLLEQVKRHISGLNSEQLESIKILKGWKRKPEGGSGSFANLESRLAASAKEAIEPPVAATEPDKDIAYAPQATVEHPDTAPVALGNIAALEKTKTAGGVGVEDLMKRIKNMGGGDLAGESGLAAQLHAQSRAGRKPELN